MILILLSLNIPSPSAITYHFMFLLFIEKLMTFKYKENQKWTTWKFFFNKSYVYKMFSKSIHMQL